MIVHCTTGKTLKAAQTRAIGDLQDLVIKRADVREDDLKRIQILDQHIERAQAQRQRRVTELTDHEASCDDCREKADGKKRLTADQKTELLALIRDGLPYQEIADAFGVTTPTVAYHASKHGLNRNNNPQAAQPEPESEPAAPVSLFKALARQGEWADEALCAQTDPESWFPEKGGSTLEGKRICQRCPVAAECLDYALENNERFGIWGGLSERERRKLTKAQRTIPCPDGCGQMFETDTNAARHAEIAHHTDPVICPDCGRNAGTNAGLTSHLRAAHPAAS